MSLLGKLFGKRSLDAERTHADALFEATEYGTAKLAYERAQDLAPDGSEIKSHLITRVAACRTRFARRRIGRAHALIAQRNWNTARRATGRDRDRRERGADRRGRAGIEGLERKEFADRSTTSRSRRRSLRRDRRRLRTTSTRSTSRTGRDERSAARAARRQDGGSARRARAPRRDRGWPALPLVRARPREARRGRHRRGRRGVEKFLASLHAEEWRRAPVGAHRARAARARTGRLRGRSRPLRAGARVVAERPPPTSRSRRSFVRSSCSTRPSRCSRRHSQGATRPRPTFALARARPRLCGRWQGRASDRAARAHGRVPDPAQSA